METTFPLHVLPASIQALINEANKALDFPVDFTGTGILFTVSVAIGNAYKIEVKKGWLEPAMIFATVVGKPGANKSHPLAFTVKPLEAYDLLLYSQYLSELKEWELAPADKRAAKPPKWKKTLVDDITPEGLVVKHLINLRGLGLAADELTSWFENFNRYNGGAEESAWLKIWSSRPLKNDRKSDAGVLIATPFVSVLGGIQPKLLHKLIEKGRGDNGFIDRILFAYPELEAAYPNNNEIDGQYEKDYEAMINRILALPYSDKVNEAKSRILTINTECANALLAWRHKLTDEIICCDDDSLGGIKGKYHIMVYRLALILELMEWGCEMRNYLPVELSMKAVEGAIALAEYFIYMATKVHESVHSSSHSMPINKKMFLSSIPDDGEISTAELLEKAKQLNIEERKFYRWLKDTHLFKKTKHGVYEKVWRDTDLKNSVC